VHEHKESNFVWIDLEMTGLYPDQHVILEIASIITDGNLNIIEQGPSLIIHHPEEQLQNIDPWSLEQHTNTGLLNFVQQSTTSIKEAEDTTLAFIKKHCAPDTGFLAGNSVWQDRIFLSKYMPHILDYLHYRLIDVTTVKELVLHWYPDNEFAEFGKKDTHRALEDLHESIAELKHYRKYFFV